MTEDNKQLEEFKITKKRFITIATIGFVILMVYFIVNVIYISELNAINKILLNKGDIDESYKWWMVLFARLSSPDEPLNLRNVLIGIAGVITLVFAWRRLRIADQQKNAQVKQTESQIKQTESHIMQTESYIRQTESRVKQTEIEADRRLSERFDNAVDALSKKLDESSFPAHLGAISSLRALAIDSSKNTQRCLDIICSCNQWMEAYIKQFIEEGSENIYSSRLLTENNRIIKEDNQNGGNQITLLHEKRSQEALAAVSYILEKVYTDNPQQIKTLKFHNKMLCGISLINMTLDGIDFQNTYLTTASLVGASLKQAKFSNTNLQRASLDFANLEGAFFMSAHLEGASLEFIHLEGASLIYSHLEGASLKDSHLEGVSLWGAHLEGASLWGAHLEGASLWNSHLERVSLWGAHLEGAYLRGADLEEALLINTQLQGAKIDNVDLSNTMLLGCNLYGAVLKDINSKNIMFNEVTDIGYIKGKKARKEFFDNICQYMIGDRVESFKEQMEVAREAMEKNKEPDGLYIIKKNSIVTKDNQGMYDISDEHLANLQVKLQKMAKGHGIFFGDRMQESLSSLKDTTGKNINLVNKLQKILEKLE